MFKKKAHYLVSRQESEQTTIKVVWALEERKALPPSATAAVIEVYIVWRRRKATTQEPGKDCEDRCRCIKDLYLNLRLCL